MRKVKIGRKLAFLEFTAKYENRGLFVRWGNGESPNYKTSVTVMSTGKCGFFRRNNQTIGFVEILDEPIKVKARRPYRSFSNRYTVISVEAIEISPESFMSLLGPDDTELLFYLDILSE